MNDLLKENKPALLFLLTFVGLYLALNTLYGFYVTSFLPQPDPITIFVSKQVAGCLSVADPSISCSVIQGSRYVPIRNVERTVISVFEGCNGINVMIVFASFLIAFGGKARQILVFLLMGCLILHLVNLLRLTLLYLTAIHRPLFFYYFHKYFFTAYSTSWSLPFGYSGRG